MKESIHICRHLGNKKINYRLKDWGISRQRYWGCPIPIAYDSNNEIKKIPIKDLPVLLPENINIETLLDNPWGAHYRTSIEIFKNKPILGNGLKSFRYQCHKYQDIVKHKRFSNCSTHPHNFYLEILIDTGIFGLTFFVFVIFLVFFDFFNAI